MWIIYQELSYILGYSGYSKAFVSFCCSEEEMRQMKGEKKSKLGDNLSKGQKLGMPVVGIRNYKKNILTKLDSACWRIMEENQVEVVLDYYKEI